MCSMLGILVSMHNVPEKDIYRPAAWNAFGMDKEGAINSKGKQIYAVYDELLSQI